MTVYIRNKSSYYIKLGSSKLLINMIATYSNYILRFWHVLIYLIIKNIYTNILTKTNFIKKNYKYYLIVIFLFQNPNQKIIW